MKVSVAGQGNWGDLTATSLKMHWRRVHGQLAASPIAPQPSPVQPPSGPTTVQQQQQQNSPNRFNEKADLSGSPRRGRKRKLEPAPYHCEVEGCSYRCNYKQLLTAHMLQHAGLKPYSCDYPGCGYRSNYQSNVSIHRGRVHSERKRQQQQQQQQQSSSSSSNSNSFDTSAPPPSRKLIKTEICSPQANPQVEEQGHANAELDECDLNDDFDNYSAILNETADLMMIANEDYNVPMFNGDARDGAGHQMANSY